jgi:hypothetical protein
LLSAENVRAAIVVTPDTTEAGLTAALLAGGGPGIVVTDVSLDFRSFGGVVSTGTYAADGATYGLAGTGIVFSTGNVAEYGSGPNTLDDNTFNFATGSTSSFGGAGVPATAAQEALLDTITGGGFAHFDVTELLLEFDVLPGFDTVFFNVVFGSEEFPEFVGDDFIDGFGLFLNDTNIATVGGLPVNINHPAFDDIPGTELDGVLAPGGMPVVTFSAPVTPGSTGNTLRFIIADTTDGVLDSTVYISSLGGTPPPPSGVIPEPTQLLIWLGLGFCGANLCRRQRLANTD